MKEKFHCLLNFTDNSQSYEMSLAVERYDESVLEEINLLSREELEIYENFKVEKRAREFIAGRKTAKESIKQLKSTQNKISIINGVWGFPIITNRELCNTCISIAHADKVAAGLFIPHATHPIGVDIEPIQLKNKPHFEKFFQYEVDTVSNRELHLRWTATEAAGKALKTGFLIPEEYLEIDTFEKRKKYYHITFKYLSKINTLAWIKEDIVIAIAFPSELKNNTIKIITDA